MEEAEAIKDADKLFRNTARFKSKSTQQATEVNKCSQRQVNNRRNRQQHNRRNVKIDCAPTLLRKQLLLRRVERAEVHKQRREDDQSGALQERDREVKIAKCSRRIVEVKDKRCETKRGEVQGIRRTATLLEQDEEADQEVGQANEIDVNDAWGPLVNGPKIVKVGPVVLCFGRIGRPLHPVVQLSPDVRCIEKHLHVARAHDFVGLAVRIESDADQAVAG